MAEDIDFVFDAEDGDWIKEADPEITPDSELFAQDAIKVVRGDKLIKVEWEENEHPRAEDGRFGTKAGERESTKEEKAKEPAQAPAHSKKSSIPRGDYQTLIRAMSFSSDEAKDMLKRHNLTTEEARTKIVNARKESQSFPSTILKHRDAAGKVTKERQAVYDKIVDTALEGKKPAEGRSLHFIITGGLPGSGKSSILEQDMYKGAVENSVLIDADDIRIKLAKVDGIDNVGTHSASYQDETDEVIEDMFYKAVRSGLDIIYDSTMKTSDRLVKFVEELRKIGGTSEVAFSDVPLEKSMTRAMARFFSGGRFVDPNYIITHDHKNMQTLEFMKSKVDKWRHWSNDVPYGEGPKLIRSDEHGG
jgi:predicted ABC-type ATPase